MNKLNIIKVINEEIKNFDFLNNEEFLKEQETIELLSKEDLQKQLICDSLLNRKDKIKIAQITDAILGGNWNEDNFEDANVLTIEYYLNLEYRYDATKQPVKFKLNFYGDNIAIDVDGHVSNGDYNTPSYIDSWFNYISWEDITVNLFTEDGDDIEFTAFKNAPHNIQTLFIREYVENFISSKTSMEVREKLSKSSIAQYC